MQIITGRIVKSAEVRKTKSNKEVVAFTLVDNDHYKRKDGKREEIATFYNCAYWISTAIAPYLNKGSLVSLYGRVGANSYKNKNGDYVANLTFQVTNIKFLAKGKDGAAPQQPVTGKPAAPVVNPETIEDLPF